MAGMADLDNDHDRKARELATRGGSRPEYEPLTVGVITAVAVFMLLDLFAAVTLPDRESAFWPAAIFTGLTSGGAAGIQWWRERAWFKRYLAALRDFGA